MPRGKNWTKEEEVKLISLMESYKSGDSDYLKLVCEELKNTFGRIISPDGLRMRYNVLRNSGDYSKVVDDGPRYVLMIHNGSKTSGTTHVLSNKQEVANKLTEYAQKYGGTIPEHTIFSRVKFEVIVKEVEI